MIGKICSSRSFLTNSHNHSHTVIGIIILRYSMIANVCSAVISESHCVCKREYETNENNEIGRKADEKHCLIRLFSYFRLFRILFLHSDHKH